MSNKDINPPQARWHHNGCAFLIEDVATVAQNRLKLAGITTAARPEAEAGLVNDKARLKLAGITTAARSV